VTPPFGRGGGGVEVPKYFSDYLFYYYYNIIIAIYSFLLNVINIQIKVHLDPSGIDNLSHF
jgi:hypothetical protein